MLRIFALRTVTGEGGQSSGGDYILVGIIGQYEAGVLVEGDGYTLTGGFWPGGGDPAGAPDIYLLIVFKDS